MMCWRIAALSCLFLGVLSDPPVFISHGNGDDGEGCKDSDSKCALWASEGECQTNAAWMMANCRRSCQSCQGGERAWKLRSHLARTYDNQTSKANFTIHNVLLQSLHLDHLEVDEETQTTTVHGRLVLTWFDKRLTWDKSKWDLSWINFYWVQIWTPKLEQQNTLKGFDEGEIKWKTLAANYTGQVYMWADFTLVSPCVFNYKRYPSDQQKCCFKIDDKRYFVVKFNVSDKAQQTARESAAEAHAAGWVLDNVQLITNEYSVPVLNDWRRDALDLKSNNIDICVDMKRITTYHSAEILGPCVATAIVTLASFLIGRFDQQIWMLIASIGLQILALQTLDHKLPPPTQGVPAIVQFYSVNLALTCVILVLMALLLCVSIMDTNFPPPHKLDLFLDFLGRCFRCMPRGSSGSEKAVDADGNPVKPGKPWARFAYTMRCVLFIVFFICYVLAMLSCLRAV